MNGPLEIWLVGATYGLSAESAARVRAEIEEHYESAVSSGATEREALVALGDAKAANRQYKKVLLTKSDVKWLDVCKRRKVSECAVLTCACMTVGAVFKSFVGAPREAVPLFALASQSFMFWISVRVEMDSRFKVYALRFLKWLAIASVPVAYAWAGQWNPIFWGYGIFPFAAYQNYRVRRKLPVEQWPKELNL